VHFSPGQPAAPGQAAANTRLILLDLPSLDWRLQETQGPPTLVLRISRVQAGNAWERAAAALSLLWSDPPLGRQLRLIRRILPQARRIGVLYDQHSEFLLGAAPGRTAAGPGNRPSAGTTPRQPPAANVLRNSDVLLGLDDPDLYNPKTAKNLLLSSYSRQWR
jgi:hypothetical protein